MAKLMSKVDSAAIRFLFPNRSEVDFLLVVYLLALFFAYVVITREPWIPEYALKPEGAWLQRPSTSLAALGILTVLAIYITHYCLTVKRPLSATMASLLFRIDSIMVSLLVVFVVIESLEKSLYTSVASKIFAGIYFIRAMLVLIVWSKLSPGPDDEIWQQVLHKPVTRREVATVFIVGGVSFVWLIQSIDPLNSFLFAMFITSLVLSVMPKVPIKT